MFYMILFIIISCLTDLLIFFYLIVMPDLIDVYAINHCKLNELNSFVFMDQVDD